MKSTAFREAHIAWFVAAFVVAGQSLAMAQRVATCKDPPGGQISCEEAQMAFCAVDGKGRVDGRCKDVPKSMVSSEAKAWALSEILGKKVTPEDLARPEYKSILEKGWAESNGKTITFSSIPTDGISALLIPARRGLPKQLSFTTSGAGSQEFSFDERPRKVLFESPTTVVEGNDLPKEIEISGKLATILRFTQNGFVIDDHHVRISGKATLLEPDLVNESR
jgi:hypothetical protein